MATTRPGFRRASDLTIDELRRFADHVQRVCYAKENGHAVRWDPDKSWDAENLQHLGAIMEELGMVPDQLFVEKPP